MGNYEDVYRLRFSLRKSPTAKRSPKRHNKSPHAPIHDACGLSITKKAIIACLQKPK